MITGARNYIDLPAVLPATGGVLAVARVIDTSGHDLMGAEVPHRRLRRRRRSGTSGAPIAPTGAQDCSTTPSTSSSVTRSPSTPGSTATCNASTKPPTGPARRLASPSVASSTQHVRATASTRRSVDLGRPVPDPPGDRRRPRRTPRRSTAAQPTLLIPRSCRRLRLRQRRLRANLDGSLIDLRRAHGSPPITTPVRRPVRCRRRRRCT